MKKFSKVASIFALTAVGFFVSCKEKDPISPINEGVGEYMPTDTANWWLYEANDGTVFKRYYTGRDTVIDGFNFNYFEQQNVNNGVIEKEFFARFEGNYYTLLKINDEGTAYVKSKVLNADPKVGDTWSDDGEFTYNNITFNAKVEGEVISVSDTATVNGVLLNDVIRVRSKLSARLPLSTWMDCGTVEMKFKKGVGLLGEYYDFHVGTYVDKTYQNWMLEYYIAP
jgi:hypothetical protein